MNQAQSEIVSLQYQISSVEFHPQNFTPSILLINLADSSVQVNVRVWWINIC